MAAPRSDPRLTTQLATPLGVVELHWGSTGLTRIQLGPCGGGPERTALCGHVPAEAGARRTVEQLMAYFDGVPVTFDGLRHVPGTAFQRRVWAALREIPYGRCRSYGEVARALDLPAGAARAVGAACGRNPLPVVCPCHRVVAADGALTGFGGGMPWKEALLALEGVAVRDGRVHLPSRG
ncbi:MAG: methylated-DNA--[protein]-cysteine S-methyltransferase [Candidatus Latescibacterota bacterium]